jgi:1-deoxy-D-xylulose-5-phosphate reductoisomerase
MPCILNAANEIAVEAFLKEKAGFREMSDIIEKTLEKVSYLAGPSLDELIAADREARRVAAEMIK